ncbi:MAG: DUF962 domain-containing protein [Saprospiraceae bacterium]|nr:DUF962 domain-containing protein [Saprospiraceae bacterium]
MKKIDSLLHTYGESHQNHINKTIHWICIPAIMFSLVGLIIQIPFPFQLSPWINWASLLLIFALIYYFRLSFTLFIGFAIISFLLLLGNLKLAEYSQTIGIHPALLSLGIFVIAWIGQFIGHHIEGKKPSFLQDIQFLLIGPAWLLHFIYIKIKLPY